MAQAQRETINITTNCVKLTRALQASYTSGQPVDVLGVEFLGLESQVSFGVFGNTLVFEGVARHKLEWTGEGLPPVETLCEAQVHAASGSLEWVKCKIIHRCRNSAAVAHGHDFGLLAWGQGFRPIRTPEQIAAEARKAQIEVLTDIIRGTEAKAKTVAEKLYDAGVRLPEAK